MSHRKLLFFSVAILTISATYAAFLIATQINTTMIVKPVVSMGVFDTDGITPLSHIDMGQFQWGTIKYFPMGEATPPTVYYFVNNTDQQSFYITFSWSDLPPDSNIGYCFYIKRGDQTAFTEVAAGELYKFPIETSIINPDPTTQYALWYFVLNVVDYTFRHVSPSAYNEGL